MVLVAAAAAAADSDSGLGYSKVILVAVYSDGSGVS